MAQPLQHIYTRQEGAVEVSKKLISREGAKNTLRGDAKMYTPFAALYPPLWVKSADIWPKFGGGGGISMIQLSFHRVPDTTTYVRNIYILI